MKNRFGFTLVELLAVVVILGILSVYAIPHLVEMLSTSRNKMYISDARKFVSEIELVLRAKSSDIEKPDDGEVLVFGLGFLDSTEFESTPNGGEYDINRSYVIALEEKNSYSKVTALQTVNLIDVSSITADLVNAKLGAGYLQDDSKILDVYLTSLD